MADENESLPLISLRRLKSLDAFRRPSGFPKFALPESQGKGVSTWIVVLVGVLIGTAIGLLIW